MNKKIFILLVAVFFIGLVSASTLYYNQDSNHDVSYKEKISKTYYDTDDHYVITRTITTNYDNTERPSTYDYRHGYSYRNTQDYYERKIEPTFQELRYEKPVMQYLKDNRGRRIINDYDDRRERNDGFFSWDKRYFTPSKEKDCYDYPPKNYLFYISCN